MRGAGEAELAVLLKAAIAGDERAYAGFLADIASRVRGFARRRLQGGGVDTEDIVQETLLAIHLKRHTWRQDAAVLPWVFAIARFKIIDAFRRRGRAVEVDISDFSETLAEPEKEAVSSRDISRVVETLAPAQKAVVSAISVEGRSIADTAKALDMTEAAVRVAFHRGLASIAARFGKN
ncbi:MAG TPA: sigma-70 family RNA polymerase sigma factor [Mesorhizobium sp.]